LIVIILLACKNETVAVGNLRGELTGTLEATDRYTLVNPGTIADLYLYTGKNNQYLISFDENDRINYIIIEDNIHSIPEKLKKGVSVKSCLEKQGVLMVEQGVCFFVAMKSGWLGYIDHINSDVEKIPDANIKFFYKKNANDNFLFIEFEKYKEKMKTWKLSDTELEKGKVHFIDIEEQKPIPETLKIEDVREYLTDYFTDGNFQLLEEALDVNFRYIYFAVHYINEELSICDTIVGFEIIDGLFQRYLLISNFHFINIDDSILYDFSKEYAGIYGFAISYSYPKVPGYTPGLNVDTYFDNGKRVADSFSIRWNEDDRRFEKNVWR
jgi:hypothetical protein